MDAAERSVHQHGIGPFVTWAAMTASGVRQLQTSRRLRKHLAPLIVSAGKLSPDAADSHISRDWSSVLAPSRIGWWIAVLFMIGSAFFAVGGLRAAWPGLLAFRWIDQTAINPIFFVGSVFFTSAAYLQLYEALNGDISAPDAPRSFFGWRPRNLGYLSSLVQFAGTLLFNLDTGDALVSGLGWRDEDLIIWTPDILGCVCFLVSSQLAVMEYAHGWFAFRPWQLSWWIVAINMLGSVLFLVSGIADFFVPGGGILAPFPANAGTFGGAVCFFLGAYLLIPEQAETSI